MKRMVVGTFGQCMEIYRRSQRHGYYDEYELREYDPETDQRYVCFDKQYSGDLCAFNRLTAKYIEAGSRPNDMYILFLTKD